MEEDTEKLPFDIPLLNCLTDMHVFVQVLVQIPVPNDEECGNLDNALIDCILMPATLAIVQ